MKRGASFLPMGVAGLVVLLSAGCGDESETVTVQIAGQHSVAVGHTLALSATTVGGTDSAYTWTSSDTTVATVDATGVVTGVAKGETTITATGSDTGAVGSHALVVVPVSATQAVVTIVGQHAVEVGKTLSLTATTKNGTDTSYAWSSADTTVATVSSSGVVTGVATGSTTISAKGATTSVTGDFLVVVVPAGSAMVVITGDVAVVVGQTVQLTATTTGGADTGYTWASDDTTYATVDSTGLVKGLAEGQVTITATGKDSKAKGSYTMIVDTAIPNAAAWLASAHADRTAEAFNHWNSDSPPQIPTTCAKCHSTPGFLDYIGADGSTAFKVDKAAPVGTVINCSACHNTVADKLSTVIFPSTVEIDDLGPEARCMTCHQGRASTDQVNTAITNAAPATADTVSSSLSFVDILSLIHI